MKLPVNYNNLHFTERREVRNEYARLQGGKCWHCGQPLTGRASEDVLAKKIDAGRFPKNFFSWPIHLHHDHVTGMTIGAVHCDCNAVLWQYHNS